ncbi:elongation factor G [Mycoplasmatota bacterium zrk1]
MKGYKPESVKNIAVLGHQGCGKTLFVESLLHSAKVIGVKGKLETGSTVSDYLKEEKDHQMTISSSIIPIEFGSYKFNFIDTPGFLDLVAETTAALRVSSAAILVIDGSSGIQVGTEKAWDFLRKYSIPTLIFINKLDKENIEFDKVITEIREKFGKGCIPVGVPIGSESDFKGIGRVFSQKERIYDGDSFTDMDITDATKDTIEAYRDMMIEAVAETSEELMEKYFEGEEFTQAEIMSGIEAGVSNGEVIPMLIGSAEMSIGSNEMLEVLTEVSPSAEKQKTQFSDTGKEVEVIEDINAPFSAICFKTVVDPFLGQMSYLQVKTGQLTKSQPIHIVGKKDKIKFNSIIFMRGKETVDADFVGVGDICVVTKIDPLSTGDTLADPSVEKALNPLPAHQPTLFKSLVPKSKNDEDKIGSAISRIASEDRSVGLLRPKETGQLLFGALGQKQIDLYLERMKNQFGVEVEVEDMEIVYRETIRGNSDVQGKYKKQSGGSGQYGDVKIRFAPTEEEFVFKEEIFGGSVPKNYIPAVEKGLNDAILTGGLAGYPVIGLEATLYDGSYHAVDSSELAFKMAASIAFKDGFMKANPVLLEPIMDVSITVPNDYTGDVMGDLSRRRGVVRGMEPLGSKQIIKAKVPQVEMLTYTIDLKSLTQARGTFEMEFESYQECPHNISEEVIAATKAKKESE